jgi:hypothetical protein
MKVIIPIRSSEIDIEFPDYEKFKSEILNLGLKKKLLELLNYENENILDIEFEYEEKDTLFQDEFYRKIFTNGSYIENDFLIIKLKTIYKEVEKEDTSWIYEQLIDRTLSGLSLLINLSYKMSLDFLRGHIIGDNKEYLGKTNIVCCHLDYAYESINKMEWPNVEGFSLETTINWFVKHKIVLNTTSNSKASRAINALSQMFGSLLEPDSSYLFWSVLGIESLLAEGINNISDQIKTKSILLFREPKEFTKKIKQLYNYRSRFVHGDMNIPPKFFYYHEEFEAEYGDYLSFSISILLALIRQLIREDKSEFKFEYKYCG